MISRSTDIRSALRSRQRGFLLNPFRFGGGGGGGGGEANTVLGLHMDGANGSTVFTDNSTYGRTVTAAGNAQISTAQSKFGGGAGLFDGSGDYLTMPSDGMNFLGADFTVEFFFRKTTSSSEHGLFEIQAAGGSGTMTFHVRVDAFDRVVTQSDGFGYIDNSSIGSVSNNVWHHYAFVRNGSNIQCYLNGTSYHSSTPAGPLVAAGSVATVGSTFYLASALNGYMDDVRVSNIARYTANFTPPTSAFPDS